MPAASRMKIVDTREDAVRLFKTFHSRNPRREFEVPWSWPKTMIYAGGGPMHAEAYESNKWQSDLKEYDDYKHVAESVRRVYVKPGWLRQWENQNAVIPLVGERVAVTGEMPKHFAVIGPLIHVQFRLFERDARGRLALPKGDENLYEVRCRGGMMGMSEFPETGRKFLFVYSPEGGIAMVLTGAHLDIGADGIEG